MLTPARRFPVVIGDQKGSLTAVETTLARDEPIVHPTLPRRARSGRWFNVAVVAVYIGIGEAAFWPVLPWSSQRLFGKGSDSILATWFLAWVPHALAHGLNPFFSNAMFAPTGVNLVQNTEAPFFGLLTAPFAIVLGPVARGNLLMELAMPISATAAFVVLRKWKVWRPAAALGGLIYGFSPYAVGQSLGHLVLIFVPLPPLIALTVVSIVQRRGSPLRLGVQLGLLLVAQFLSEPEVFTTVVIVTVWALICVAIARPEKVHDVLSGMIKPIATASALAAVLLAYPTWMLLAGPQHYKGTAQPMVNPYYNDLLTFVSPGPLQRFTLGVHSLPVAPSNSAEIDGFIGIPLLVLAIGLAWNSRRSARMQLTVVVLLGAALLSLGPHLAVNHHLTQLPLPFWIVTHVPLLDNILASRISLEVAAGVAAVIAFGLDDVSRRSNRVHQHSPSGRSRAATALVGVVLAALVVSWLPRWPNGDQPAEALPVVIRQATPRGDPVALTYPYASPAFAQPLLWQAADGFGFRLVGGGTPSTPTRTTGPPASQILCDLPVWTSFSRVRRDTTRTCLGSQLPRLWWPSPVPPSAATTFAWSSSIEQ